MMVLNIIYDAMMLVAMACLTLTACAVVFWWVRR